MKSKWLFLILFSLLLSVFYGVSSAEVIVKSVVTDGKCSGILKENDILFSFSDCRGGNVIAVDSPFDVQKMQFEKGMISDVCAEIERDERRINVTLPMGEWGIDAWPVLQKDTEDRFKEILLLLEEGKQSEALDALNTLTANEGDSEKCWMNWKCGDFFRGDMDQQSAILFYDRAMESSQLSECERMFILWSKGMALGEMYRFAEAYPVLEQALSADVTALLKTFVYNDYANLIFNEGKPADALKIYIEGLETRRREAPATLLEAENLNDAGQMMWELGDLTGGQKHFEDAYEIVHAIAPGTMDEAAVFNNFGLICYSRGDLPGALEHFMKSLKIKELLAPESWDTLNAHSNLGVIYYSLDRLDKAEEHCGKAMEITGRIAPGTTSMATILNTLGAIVLKRGDLKGAEEYFTKALDINRKLVPDSLDVATNLDNLGTVVSMRGDLSAAEKYYMESIAITERDAPNDPTLGTSLMNLGILYSARHDYEESENYLQKALEITRKSAPGSLSEATCLNNLAGTVWELGDKDKAMEIYEESLSIRREKLPGSWEVANSLNNIASLAITVNNLEKAETALDESLGIFKDIAPGSTFEASVLHNLAKLNIRKKDPGKALECFEGAQIIVSYLIPGTMEEAGNYYWMGRILEEQGNDMKALDCYRKSLEALELQKLKLGGGSQSTEAFSEEYKDFYKRALELEVKLGLDKEAYRTLERYRAQSLLQMLAQRDIDFSKDVPSGLLKKQNELQKQYSRTINSMSAMNREKDAVKIDKAREELAKLKLELRRNENEIREASLELGALKFPEPFGLQETAKLMEKGTLFLSYAVCDDAVCLFSILNGKLDVYRIEIKRNELSDAVMQARMLLSDPRSAERYKRVMKRLGDALMGPVALQINKSDRIVVCPDGSLHQLPFTALITGKGFSVTGKPVSYVTSATVLGEIRRNHPGMSGKLKITAFGNPEYPGADADNSVKTELRALIGRDELSSLPSTEAEVKSIAEIFSGNTKIYLGVDASEQKARNVGASVTNIHFACHGFANELNPLESGLALTVPEKPAGTDSNGFLQAWEIFEGIRINADLVTLSACETALGKEMGGEGLIGLTRAFQYAGAKTVMSTLWSVADESTAELMKHFYSYLNKGKSKDVALMSAQRKMMKSREYSHPFYWAAFQLNGDWK